jgi:hypothetical protein
MIVLMYPLPDQQSQEVNIRICMLRVHYVGKRLDFPADAGTTVPWHYRNGPDRVTGYRLVTDETGDFREWRIWGECHVPASGDDK